jgi:hypothetical protein
MIMMFKLMFFNLSTFYIWNLRNCGYIVGSICTDLCMQRKGFLSHLELSVLQHLHKFHKTQVWTALLGMHSVKDKT